MKEQDRHVLRLTFNVYEFRFDLAVSVSYRPKTVIRGVALRSIEDTAVIEWLLTRPERNVER